MRVGSRQSNRKPWIWAGLLPVLLQQVGEVFPLSPDPCTGWLRKSGLVLQHQHWYYDGAVKNSREHRWNWKIALMRIVSHEFSAYGIWQKLTRIQVLLSQKLASLLCRESIFLMVPPNLTWSSIFLFLCGTWQMAYLASTSLATTYRNYKEIHSFILGRAVGILRD